MTRWKQFDLAVVMSELSNLGHHKVRRDLVMSELSNLGHHKVRRDLVTSFYVDANNIFNNFISTAQVHSI